MAKPRLIILIRHAQSEGNKNRDIHQTVPDHRVKLTNDGWQQAYEAGRRLRSMLRADDTLHFFTSPYRRTRETTEGIVKTLTSDDPEPSPFKRNNIKIYEEPRLREQDFGNFQPCSAEMERMWQERADYGHFFYRIPDGESAADAYDRVSGFNESLWRQFGDDDFASVCVLVTHGLMSRVFLMKWYHFSVEYFEDLRNVNHCEFLIMRKKEDSGKYALETKMRTWSELRRERAKALRQKEEDAAREAAASGSSSSPAKDKDGAKLERTATSLIPQRRWGGCPNGCNHDKSFKIRSGLADLIQRDGTNVYDDNSKAGSAAGAGAGSKNSAAASASAGLRRPAVGLPNRRFQSVGYSDDENDNADEENDDDDDHTRASSPTSTSAAANTPSESGHSAVAHVRAAPPPTSGGGAVPPNIDVRRAQEEIVSSPDATPSFITPEVRQRAQQALLSATLPPPHKSFLHVGRDFGGTYSGHTSDADSSEDDRVRHRMARLKMSLGGSDADTTGSGSGSGSGSAHGHGHSHARHHVHRDHGHHGHHNAGGYQSLDAAAESPASVQVSTTVTVRAPAGAGPASGAAHTAAAAAGIKRVKSMANRLGDAPHCSDCEREDEMDMDDALAEQHAAARAEAQATDELRDAEREDRSIQGSVF